jgi:hypothetical protein
MKNSPFMTTPYAIWIPEISQIYPGIRDGAGGREIARCL